jgi:hypothetical protein
MRNRDAYPSGRSRAIVRQTDDKWVRAAEDMPRDEQRGRSGGQDQLRQGRRPDRPRGPQPRDARGLAATPSGPRAALRDVFERGGFAPQELLHTKRRNEMKIHAIQTGTVAYAAETPTVGVAREKAIA